MRKASFSTLDESFPSGRRPPPYARGALHARGALPIREAPSSTPEAPSYTPETPTRTPEAPFSCESAHLRARGVLHAKGTLPIREAPFPFGRQSHARSSLPIREAPHSHQGRPPPQERARFERRPIHARGSPSTPEAPPPTSGAPSSTQAGAIRGAPYPRQRRPIHARGALLLERGACQMREARSTSESPFLLERRPHPRQRRPPSRERRPPPRERRPTYARGALQYRGALPMLDAPSTPEAPSY
eukprot:GHVH01017296.1.p1 GENE.GHVH01017296.1~~GHVH01017296.1.p1  ORF type:complete len:245 (-),score=14.17 GHVH01017296.1:292-1026(-)